ncbi:uncharacterized protein LOC134245307 [Saccostrea cucullata]|uniref:uncharacterized protein LOC134245307 n=1 Tax=Saccostrea cuccullata TaxID=36930 RepID=UPI002ED1CA1E
MWRWRSCMYLKKSLCGFHSPVSSKDRLCYRSISKVTVPERAVSLEVSPVSMADVPQKVPQFYRRVLPQTCISFYSEEGKKIFREALDSGHMECYFKLAAQFRTQDEPAFCGLTTLVIALNALEVDPGEVWKGPWRWYHERMLDCCIPISLVEQEGITFTQFVCLAECNSLEVQPTKAGTGGTLEQFRDIIIEYTKRDDEFLILSYSRKTLNQTGDGHFSPVGGYHPEKDLVLMLDTARFKYPPHWVTVDLLWEAMHALDKTTGEPRGYLTVKKKMQSSHTEQRDILTLFKISPSFDITNVKVFSPGISPFITQWQDWLEKEYTEQEGDNNAVQYIIQNLDTCAEAGDENETVFTTQIDIKCVGDISKAHACVVHQLLNSIEKTSVYKAVTDFLTQQGKEHHLDKLGRITSNLSSGQEECLGGKLTTAHFVVMFLFSWPYEDDGDHSVKRNKDVLLNLKSEAFGNVLSGEFNILRKQFTSLLKLRKEKMAKRKKCSCHK